MDDQIVFDDVVSGILRDNLRLQEGESYLFFTDTVVVHREMENRVF